MRTVLRLVLVAAIVLVLAWFVANIPGSVMLDADGYSLQTSPPVALLLAGVLFLVAYFALRLLATLVGLPGAFRRVGSARARRRGDTAVGVALTALATRDTGEARRASARARRLLGDTPQTLLLAAYSAAVAGRQDEAEAAFRALAERKDGAFLGLRGLMRQAMAREDWTQAAELARRAEAVEPGASWLRAERAQLAVRQGAWREAAQLTDETRARAALETRAAEAETDPDAALRLARDAFRHDSGLTAAALAYAAALRRVGKQSRAFAVLRDAWTANPHPDLAEAALADTPDPGARLQLAQGLTRYAAMHPETQLLLGRLALAAGQTDTAKRHATAALREANQLRVHRLLAEIAEVTGDDRGRDEALRGAASAMPDPAWQCEACHSTLDRWHASCPVCHATGTVRWVVTAATRPASVPAVAEEGSGLILPPP